MTSTELCSGLMELATFIRGNIVNHRGVNYDPKNEVTGSIRKSLKKELQYWSVVKVIPSESRRGPRCRNKHALSLEREFREPKSEHNLIRRRAASPPGNNVGQSVFMGAVLFLYNARILSRSNRF